MIHESLDPSCRMESEGTVSDSGVQYNIGKSEKFSVHIPTFLQQNDGDPAIKVNQLHPFLGTNSLTLLL